jgi:hypothetical protein
VLRLTKDEGTDEIDGSEVNAVRRRALELLTRSEDALTDAELFASQTDDYWYIDLCLEQLHRLPSEVDPLIGCREYTRLQAYYLVRRAIDDMQRLFREGG